MLVVGEPVAASLTRTPISDSKGGSGNRGETRVMYGQSNRVHVMVDMVDTGRGEFATFLTIPSMVPLVNFFEVVVGEKKTESLFTVVGLISVEAASILLEWSMIEVADNYRVFFLGTIIEGLHLLVPDEVGTRMEICISDGELIVGVVVVESGGSDISWDDDFVLYLIQILERVVEDSDYSSAARIMCRSKERVAREHRPKTADKLIGWNPNVLETDNLMRQNQKNNKLNNF